MSNKLWEEYEHFIYSLPDRYPVINYSTLVLKTIGATIAKVEGEIHFPNLIRLRVFELVDVANDRIVTYTYQIYRADECLYWYDPMEHPKDPTLAESHPHHKHIEPNIKHHRVPAPELSFQFTNHDTIIREILDDFLADNASQ
jgi:hypothetical protein